MLIAGGGGSTVKVRFAVFVCGVLEESCTWKVSGVLLAVAVGVPVIAPVPPFRERPAGSVPLLSDQV